MKRDRYRELRSLLRPDGLADDVAEELASHLEMRIADLQARGMEEGAAREEALRRFGDAACWEKETLAIDESMVRETRRMELFDTIRRETRHTLRSLKRAPVFTAVAVLTLGVGIGATTAIFSLLDAIVLRPLPYPESERLVQVTHAVPLVSADAEWQNSVASFYHYADNSTTLESTGGVVRVSFNIGADDAAARVEGAAVTPSMLHVLGARVVLGRPLVESDAAADAPPVAVLGHDLWQSRFGGRGDVIGSTVRLNSDPVTIVGVLEPGLTLPEHATQVWTPLRISRADPPANSHWLSVYARMRPGVTADAAQRELQGLTARLPELLPDVYGGGFVESTGFAANVSTLRSSVLGGMARVLWLLLGAVGLVLVIACANVANLMLVRAEAKRRELTLRSALGAERAHLVVHYLTESLLLAAAAGAVGVMIAYAAVAAVVRLAPDLPRIAEAGVDARSLLFTTVLAAATGIVFGLVPAIRTRMNFAELRESGRGMTASRARQFARSALVVTQVGLALVLLAAGALMLQSARNLARVQSGFDAHGVLTFQAYAPPSRYGDQESVLQFHARVIEQLEAIPGVAGASAVTQLPLTATNGRGMCAYTVVEGRANPEGESSCRSLLHVLPGYFDVMGIPIEEGRAFDWQDVRERSGGVVVSRSFAQRMWPDGNAIGRRLISYESGPPWYHVIGVAADVRSEGLDRPAVEMIYYPTRSAAGAAEWMGPFGDVTFVLKSDVADPASLVHTIRGVVSAADPEVPLAEVRTMRDVMNSSPRVASTSFMMLLLAVSAVMSLFLSGVGLYGVIAYLVGRRRSEIGVRIALGARVAEVTRMVVLQSVRITLLGIAIGLVAALAGTRLIATVLFEVEPADPLTLGLVSFLLLAVAVAASAIPARRASRIAPTEALRSD